MIKAERALDKIISASPAKPSPSQAREILRNCGIMNGKNQVKPAYKTMFVHSGKANADK